MPMSILARSLLAAVHPDLAKLALVTAGPPTAAGHRGPAAPPPTAPAPAGTEGPDRPGGAGTR
jgi:hypothetical protein